GALGLTGVVAFLILEWNRGRRTDGRPRALDGTRVAAIVSLVSGAFLIGSGIVSGFVYVGAFWVGAGIHAALWLALALSAGLFLFWTAGQIGPEGIRLRQLALALGVPRQRCLAPRWPPLFSGGCRRIRWWAGSS